MVLQPPPSRLLVVPAALQAARAAALLAALGACLPAPASACDSTGCLLATRGDNALLRRGQFQVDISFRTADQTARLEGGDEVDRVQRPKVDFERGILRPGFHDEIGGRDRFVQVDAAYGLGGRTALLLSMPVFTQRAYEVGHGSVVTAYDTRGFGDALLGVRRALAGAPGRTLMGGLAFKMPVGSSRLTDPFDGSLLEPSLQPGTGSRDVVASLQYGRPAFGGRLSWSTSASYQLNSTNARKYRFGNEAIGTLGASLPLPARLTASLQVKAFQKGRSQFLGGDVPSTGGRVLYLTPGLRWQAAPTLGAYGFVQVPVHRFVNETQLGPRLGVLLGLSKAF
jgi:hypothetical protein